MILADFPVLCLSGRYGFRAYIRYLIILYYILLPFIN